MGLTTADSTLSFHLLSSAVQNKYLVPAVVCVTNNVHIVRTLDPEDEHQISLARVFRAANLSVVEGLVRYKLTKGFDFHTQLGFAGPNLLEVWVSVSRIRSIVADLWARPPESLVHLLAPCMDSCWTLFDSTRSSLLHNWKLSTINSAAYSTSLLLGTTFSIDQVVPLHDKSCWIRTGVPEKQYTAENQSVEDIILLKWAFDASERYFMRDTNESDLVVDRWTPAIHLMSDHRKHGSFATRNTNADVLRSTRQIETDVLAAFEYLIRHQGSFPLPTASETVPRKKIGSKTRSIACQTTAEYKDEACCRDIGCQTTERQALRKAFLLVPILFVFVAIVYVMRF